MKLKHFISTEQLSKSDLEEIFHLADKIKENKNNFSSALNGYVIATLFYEPSTRTRMSFESAIQRLGAKVISTENARENASAVKGESLEDTIRIVEGYADAIILRHFEDDSAERAAAVAKIPIINAGSGRAEHPTQAVLDIYTIKELKGKVDGLKVAIMGDLKYGRTPHSLIQLLSLYNDIEIYGFSVNSLELPDSYVEFLKSKNIRYIKCDSFNQIPRDIDVIYQTRVQRERLEGKIQDTVEFNIDTAVLKSLSKDTLIMHPLPRVLEINSEIDNDPRAVYFKQAHNGIPTRMATLILIMNYLYAKEKLAA